MIRSRLAVFGILVLGFSAPAAAQSPSAKDPAAAEALFKEGIKLLDAGDWAGACPKFAASLELDPSPGTSINVARCHEHDGKLAKAWAEYEHARALARETGGSRRQEIEAFVDRAVAALEPRLPRLRIDVKPRPAGLRVLRDGQPFPVGALGERVPVDPGKHVVVAEAPGHASVQRDVEVAEGALGEVVIELAPTVAAPAATAQPTTAPASEPRPPPPARDEATGGGSLRFVSYGLIGLGAVGVGVGAVTGLMAMGKSSDVESSCETKGHTCVDQSGIDAASSGRTLAIVSTIGFGAGAALAATGVVLLVVGPKPAPSRSARIGASFDATSAGISWGGWW